MINLEQIREYFRTTIDDSAIFPSDSEKEFLDLDWLREELKPIIQML